MIRLSALVAASLVSTSLAVSQDMLPTPQASPHAQVVQTVGLTEIAVDYHRPAVRGRQIFGGLLPWGAVWRVGANENTTIRFEHPVTVGGELVPEGVYGVHMIPDRDEWTVILSSDSTAWGSLRYSERNDAARVTVVPEPAPFCERMLFTFDEVDEDSTVLALRWEELRVAFEIGTATHERVLGPVREAFAASDEEAGWQYWFEAADYGLVHDVDPHEALAWTEKSISVYRNFTNLWMKSDLLIALDRTDEAEAVRDEALTLVTADELSNLGYRYMRHDEYGAAAAVFAMVVQMAPGSWWAYDMLGQARLESGDEQGAVEAWKQALAHEPDDASRTRIAASVRALESTEG